MELSSSLIKAIDKYLAGDAGPEEDQLVNDWYHSFDDREVEIPEQVMELRNKVGERIWHRLTETIDAEEEEEAALVSAPEKQAFPIRRFLLVAASLLLVFLGTTYFYINRLRANKAAAQTHNPIVNDIAPGGNKAILTLTNGSTIVLDSAHIGMLARQGTTKIVKLDSGKLAYHVTSRHDDANEPPSYNTITTPRGGQFRIMLPDGTNVWLNAASSLRYPTRFRAGARKVQLTGEAYFEVARNPAQPFIVDMPDHGSGDSLHIQVLGTSFDVNGYDDEETIRTTLVEGSVKVVRKRNSSVILPGQQAQTNPDGGFRIVRHADLEETLAWKNGFFQFNSTSLPAIMRQIARWYDVQITYAGKMDDEFFSGSVPRSENVSQILRMLAMTNTVHFTIGEKAIRVERVEEK